MKELLKQDSKLRRAQCEALAELEKAIQVAVVFHRPLRRCSEPTGKIKTHFGIQFQLRLASGCSFDKIKSTACNHVFI
jgi:copper homeostasis protein CutC